MIVKIICIFLAVVCAVIAFSAKKILERVLKREPDEKEIVLLKAVMLLACIAIAMTMILPDYM